MAVESVLSCAPAGNAYCHGGPGTGKTYFGKELGKIFVRHPAADRPSGKIQVGFFSPNDNCADSQAQAFTLAIHELEAAGDVQPNVLYTVRYHAYTSEQGALLSDASAKHTFKEGAKPLAVTPLERLDQESGQLLENCRFANYVRTRHDKTFAWKKPGVKGKRAKWVEMSLGCGCQLYIYNGSTSEAKSCNKFVHS